MSPALRCRLSGWRNSSLSRIDESAAFALWVPLVPALPPQAIAAVFQALEQIADRRMVDWLFGLVADQILLADIGDVRALRILGEQVIEWLVLARAQALGNRFVPSLAVGEDRIDIEDHAAEIEHPVAHDIANGEAGERHVDFGGHRC